jgi:putative transposase
LLSDNGSGYVSSDLAEWLDFPGCRCDLTPAFSEPGEMRELSLEGELAMPKGRRLGAEQIVTKLRQIEVLQGQGKNIAAACKEIGTTEQTFYRWRKEYGGLNVDQAKRLKQLEDENGRLKKLVADLSLEKQVLRDIAQGKL